MISGTREALSGFGLLTSVLLFSVWLYGCDEGSKYIPATQVEKNTNATVYKYEDDFVLITCVRPNTYPFCNYWITEDRATGARIFTQQDTSGTPVGVCPLPPLPRPSASVEKAP